MCSIKCFAPRPADANDVISRDKLACFVTKIIGVLEKTSAENAVFATEFDRFVPGLG